MNNTEVQGGSPDVASVLKYIAEREENLGKYSDKLRGSVQRIFNIFGDPKICQNCLHHIHAAPHGKYVDRKDYKLYQEFPGTHPHGTPKLVAANEFVGKWGGDDDTIYFHEVENYHPPHPKLHTSIEMRSEVFYDDGDARWYLDLSGQGLSFGVKTPRGEGIRSAEEAPRRVLKELVKSGRLTAFLQDIADALKGESEEYKEVAEIAERMAQAIP